MKSPFLWRISPLFALTVLAACSSSVATGTGTGAGDDTTAADSALGETTTESDAASDAEVAEVAIDQGFFDETPCPSGKHYTKGHSVSMEPGNACITCHDANNGPGYTFAGTVYPNLVAENRCYGLSSQVSAITVELTGSDGVVSTAHTNTVGNFFSGANVKMPYTARIIDADGNERVMNTPQTTGDCNSCHTPTGQKKAPGRIVAPMVP